MAARRGPAKARRTKKASVPAARRVAPAKVRVPVENVLPGTILHLGDGRRLAYGECLDVPAAAATLLIARGQARTVVATDPKPSAATVSSPGGAAA